MRRYAKISPQMWIGETGRKLRDAGHETMLVALYLLSNPHSNMLGLYYLPKLFIAHETGLGVEGAAKGLRRAIEEGFCAYDEASEVVFVYEMARYQIADHLQPSDKQCAGIQREYEGLPNNPFLAMFYEKYVKAFNLKTRRENARASEGASMGHRSQEQEQEQEKKISSEQTRSDAVILPSKKQNQEPSREAIKLAALLKSEILRNRSDYRITPQQERKWAITADRMLRIDKRKFEEAAELIRWVQRNEFWMANVLSMDKLREKFDQLAMASKSKNHTRPPLGQKLPADYVPASEQIKRELQQGTAVAP